MKRTIIAIVGPSGSGKTVAARFARNATGVELICSYTTRPQRLGECDGLDHWFVSEKDMPPRESMMAYTFFGGHHYWTTRQQFEGEGVRMYIVDEQGLRDLLSESEKDSDMSVYSIYIDRDIPDDIDTERTDRDKQRVPIELDRYNHVILNNGSIEHLYVSLSVAVSVVSKYRNKISNE